jgi:hypothetical protein
MFIRFYSIILYVLLCLFISCLNIQAAEGNTEKTTPAPAPAETVVVNDLGAVHEVNVYLTGVTRYEVVEMFHFLLVHSPMTANVDQVETLFTPARPGACKAVWKVTVADPDTFNLENDLFAAIRQLQPEGENPALEKLHFKAEADDIIALKQIRPYSATEDSLVLVSAVLGKAPLLQSGCAIGATNDSGFD